MSDDGVYARKQLGCPVGLMAFSHERRFRVGHAILRSLGARRVLDYGCGDGTFLERCAPELDAGLGVDLALDLVAACRTRLAGASNLAFATTDELAAMPPHTWDAAVCMETLEHCLDAEVDRVLDVLMGACRPTGALVISVPIESGPPVLVKQAARRLAAARGSADYASNEHYPPWTMARQLLATARTQIARPVYTGTWGPFHPHYGFNWRRLRARVAERCGRVVTRFSPLPALGGLANSQAWFICRPPFTPTGKSAAVPGA